MAIDKHIVLLIVWGLWLLFWGVMSLKVKRTHRAEMTRSRVLHLLLACSAFALIFTDRFQQGFLAERFVPDSDFFTVLGMVVLLGGFFLGLWSRVRLGQNWSAKVTIKTDHQLIQHGPYAWVRHPIYTAIVTAMLGSAILLGETRGILATALLLIAYLRKLKQEERLLVEHFGDAYRAYQAKTKAIIPFVL